MGIRLFLLWYQILGEDGATPACHEIFRNIVPELGLVMGLRPSDKEDDLPDAALANRLSVANGVSPVEICPILLNQEKPESVREKSTY